jgi:hypothetical protein
MKKFSIVLVFSIFTFFLVAGSAMAIPLGNNITSWDKVGTGINNWYGTQEDNEVEWPSNTGQQWDLEGFFLNGSVLTM